VNVSDNFHGPRGLNPAPSLAICFSTVRPNYVLDRPCRHKALIWPLIPLQYCRIQWFKSGDGSSKTSRFIYSLIAAFDYDQRKRGAALCEVQQRVDIHGPG